MKVREVSGGDPGISNSWCQGPEAGQYLIYLRKSEDVRVVEKGKWGGHRS